MPSFKVKMARMVTSTASPLPSSISMLPNAPPAKGSPRSLSGLVPFLRPYSGRIGLAVLFLVMAAVATLVFPLALRGLIAAAWARPTRASN